MKASAVLSASRRVLAASAYASEQIRLCYRTVLTALRGRIALLRHRRQYSLPRSSPCPRPPRGRHSVGLHGSPRSRLRQSRICSTLFPWQSHRFLFLEHSSSEPQVHRQRNPLALRKRFRLERNGSHRASGKRTGPEHFRFENAPGVERSETPPRRRSSRSSLAAYRARIGSPCRQILSRAKCSNGRTAGQWPWHPFFGECQASAAPGCAAEKGYRHRRPRRQPDFSPRPHSRRGEIPVHWEPCWQ